MSKPEDCNNCFECPFRGKVIGSAHSMCHHPVATSLQALAFAGRHFTVQNKDEPDRPFIEINEHGFQRGWAFWPLNFDPIWVTCRLPVEIEAENT